MAISGVGAGPAFQGDFGRQENEVKDRDPFQEILEKKEEIYNKVIKGETEQSFQIGASSFTLKEWDRFLEKFDKGQEELEELIREAKEELRKKMAEKAAGGGTEEKEKDEENFKQV